MKEVTDPALLAQLNSAPALKPVTDPAILAQLNGAAHSNPPAQEASKPPLLISMLGGALRGASSNFIDPLGSAWLASFPSVSGKMGVPGADAPNWSDRYHAILSDSQAHAAQEQKSHPIGSFLGSVAGGFANPITRALPAAQTLGGAVAQGAGIGASYGLGSGVSAQKDLGGVATDAGIGGVTGGVLGAASHGLSRMLMPATKTPSAMALNAEGVPTTIGQSLGGTAQRLEDSHTSIPLYGDAIRDQQRTGIQEFNRATYNRVLEPLGLSYAKDGPVGNQGIQKLDDLIGQAYDKAFDGAKVDATHPAFTDGGEQILQEAQSVLPPERFKSVVANVDRLINSKIDNNGELSGKDLIQAKNWFSEQSRTGPTATQDEQNVAGAYKQVLGLIKGGIGASDPDRGALLKAADNSFMRFVRVSGAASSNNASGKEGLFTPNQFGTAIRTAENSARKGAFAMGESPMQDLAQAGQQSLSQTVPDSGTAMRTIFEHPLSALATSPAWLAGRALYSKPGQAAANAVLFGAPASRKAIAKVPPLLLPGALGLIGSDASQRAP